MLNLPMPVTIAINLIALYSAYNLGQMAERPAQKWPKGSFPTGWEARKTYLYVAIALSLGLAVLAGMGGGMGYGGGGGGYY
jgi:hypothetical protein